MQSAVISSGDAKETEMDGMNWFRKDEANAIEQRRLERKELWTALALTAVSVLVAFIFVLGLNATGIVMAGEEFSSPPVATAASGIMP
jgi:hypothetical protein